MNLELKLIDGQTMLVLPNDVLDRLNVKLEGVRPSHQSSGWIPSNG